MNNKTEKINGTLFCTTVGTRKKPNWAVSCGYRIFQLADNLQHLPQTDGEVEATVLHGIVIDYNFIGEGFDKP